VHTMVFTGLGLVYGV